MASICGEHEYAGATGGSFSITKRKAVVQEASPEILSPTNGLMPEKKQKRKVFSLHCVSDVLFEVTQFLLLVSANSLLQFGKLPQVYQEIG